MKDEKGGDMDAQLAKELQAEEDADAQRLLQAEEEDALYNQPVDANNYDAPNHLSAAAAGPAAGTGAPGATTQELNFDIEHAVVAHAPHVNARQPGRQPA